MMSDDVVTPNPQLYTPFTQTVIDRIRLLAALAGMSDEELTTGLKLSNKAREKFFRTGQGRKSSMTLYTLARAAILFHISPMELIDVTTTQWWSVTD
jgi:hypothetical protein